LGTRRRGLDSLGQKKGEESFCVCRGEEKCLQRGREVEVQNRRHCHKWQYTEAVRRNGEGEDGGAGEKPLASLKMG
jgi:hypothetical protein